MYKLLLTKTLITAEILLFLSLPFIPLHALAKSKSAVTPTVVLKEENLASVAQFKSFEDKTPVTSFEVFASKAEPKKEESSEEPEAAKITPAVQSVAYFKKESQPQPTAGQPLVDIDISNSPQSLTPEQIAYLGNCEAGMDPTKNTGNGYYGAFQFSFGTWQSMNTGYTRADLAPLEVQIDAVQRLLQRSSIYTQFPACARKMQAAGLI